MQKIKVTVISVHALKAYGVVEVYFRSILISVLDGRKWSASFPGYFNPRQGARDRQSAGGWVGHIATLDA
jgi:hypothetical protein